MPKIKINDQTIEAAAGETILQAANKAFIRIPNLCSHENLSPFGACRLCTVEIKKNDASGLTSACTYPVEEGLEVRTDTDAVKRARKLAAELLLACNPNAKKVRDVAKEVGVEKSSFTTDQRECILCGLCVRACREKVGAEAITFIDQGKGRDVKEPTVEHNKDKCIGCDSCAFICPTSAITVEDKKGVRTLKTPSRTLKFNLKKCKICGSYWIPEKQAEYLAEKSGQPVEIFEVCPNCR
jgi:bidirectional [NiFe] hydrogenase diaphorase subunit